VDVGASIANPSVSLSYCWWNWKQFCFTTVFNMFVISVIICYDFLVIFYIFSVIFITSDFGVLV
jgi:hypothetical protein